MAEKGINLILLARREDNLIKIKEDIQAKFSINIMVIAADLSQIPEYERIYDECKRNDLMPDFLVNNAILNLAFDVNSPIQLYRNAQTLKNTEPDHPTDKRLNDVSIPLCWSTVIYFNKSPMSKMFFDMWKHVKENYDYYQSVYKFPQGLYRTDFAVSISMHLLKGFNDCVDDVFAELPASPMKYMAYKDDIASVDKNGIVFFANEYGKEWNNILTYSEGENLHMMNKRAIDRHYNKLMELYV